MIEFDPTLVHEWLTRSARRYPEKEALVYGDQRWTYKTLYHHTNHLANALIDAGVQRQDRVVIFLDNCSETVISLYGTLKAGAIFVILEGSIKHIKLRYVLQNCSPKVLITHVRKSKVVNEALKDIDIDCKVVWIGTDKQIAANASFPSLSWNAIFSDIGKTNAESSTIATDKFPRCVDVDLAALIYTSGSTGQPKGVMSTHHNMISAARSIIQYLENSEDDIIFNVLPLSFDYGLYQIIMAFMFGGTVILKHSFIYLHTILEDIAKEKATGFPVVPTVVTMLLQMQDLSKYDFSSLRYITNTGAALPAEHIRKLRALFPHVKIYSMYGLTECKRVAYMPPDKLDQKLSSVGKAMPNCEVFIVDEDGNEVGPNIKGELVIRGSNVMQGYWRDPEVTKRSYKEGKYPDDRMLYSGDYFKKDEEGFLYFMGRKDDIIKSRGERVSLKEVENTLAEMPGVLEVAVIALPDKILGQAIKAFIVLQPDVTLTENEVLRFCASNLETFANPKYVVLTSRLPKTPHGKIDKKRLQTREEHLTDE